MRNVLGNFTAPKLRSVFGGRNVHVDQIVPPIEICSSGRQELPGFIQSRFNQNGAIVKGHYHVVACCNTGTVKAIFLLRCGLPYGVLFDMFGKPYDIAF
jgi:hypothetical protein